MKKFDAIFLKEFDTVSNDMQIKDIWKDVILKVLSESGRDKILITLKADLDIITKIVDGLSAYSISTRLGVPSKDVYDVADLWGFMVLPTSLDVSSFVIYRSGMSADTFQSVYNSITPISLDINIARAVVGNLDHYEDILYYIEEGEKDDERNITT